MHILRDLCIIYFILWEGFLLSIRSEEEEEILAYACYKILSKYGDGPTYKLDSLRFNKMIAMLDHELQDEVKLILKTPICWYYYGEEVVPTEMPSCVRFEPRQASDDDISSFWWVGERPRPDSRKKSKIDAKVDSLFSRFPPTMDIYEVVAKDYDYAPFEFQRKYKEFRSDSLILSDVDPDGRLRSKILYGPGIRSAFSDFPFKEFPVLKVAAAQVEILTAAIFKKLPMENKKGIKIARSFWEMFCKLLRIYSDEGHKGHRNVSNQKLEFWRTVAEDTLRQYLIDLQEEINTIMRLLPENAIEDPMERMFLQPLEFESQEDIDKALYS